MYKPLILNKLNEKCITLVSLYWYTVMRGQQYIKFTICVTTADDPNAYCFRVVQQVLLFVM
jgi:hypothetical protein